jgi:hypothetical protein
LCPTGTHVAVTITNHGIQFVAWLNFFVPPMHFLTGINFDNAPSFFWWSVAEHLFTKPNHAGHRFAALASVTVAVWANKDSIEVSIRVNIEQHISHGIMNLVNSLHAP